MLQIKNLHTYYGHIHAVKGVSLHVKAGEIVALIGGNGAGKSTILRAVTGMVRAASGDILLESEEITRLSSERILRSGIGHVPEGRRLFRGLSVRDNLILGAYTRRDKVRIKTDIEDMEQLFPILGQRRSQMAGTLSGGEQQMLAIARSLMARPRVLLLDEPSMGLAPIVTGQIYEQIRHLNTVEGISILLVEQNAHLALNLAHRGYVIETGRIVMEGESFELSQSNEIQRAYLGKGYKEVWE
ncbi:MAG TPA: ABC transporter ATP-binding protein [Desulfomonilia bacterium]|nr:ABC transporter ATP-binding protein [Desulfomonilia bacterium]